MVKSNLPPPASAEAEKLCSECDILDSFQEIQNALLLYAEKRTPSNEDPEEVVASVIETAWKKYVESGLICSLPMLFGILKNKIGDSYRSGHARNEVPSEPGDLPLESLPSQDEEVITNLCIGELLQQLSGTDRTVLLLACVNDMSISDIASLLGKSEGSIRTRLSRVKANLRRDGIPRVL